MGLDMYLTKSYRLGTSSYNITTLKLEAFAQKTSDDGVVKEIPFNINPNKVDSITEECAYWRKANAIHKWFVDNVQEGQDNCARYYVGIEDLKALRDTCKRVMDDPSKAATILPSASGFFFGGTEYDDWYFSYVEDTYNHLTKLIEEYEATPDAVKPGFYYQSSW